MRSSGIAASPGYGEPWEGTGVSIFDRICRFRKQGSTVTAWAEVPGPPWSRPLEVDR